MDPSSVLLALEERKKWRERRKRIKDRILQLERRRVYLQRELQRVRKKASDYHSLLAGLKARRMLGDRTMPPSALR